jgi:hypothetical protein
MRIVAAFLQPLCLDENANTLYNDVIKNANMGKIYKKENANS